MNFIVYVWRGTYSMAVVSVEDEKFVAEFRQWAEGQGYRVEVKRAKINGGGERKP